MILDWDSLKRMANAKVLGAGGDSKCAEGERDGNLDVTNGHRKKVESMKGSVQYPNKTFCIRFQRSKSNDRPALFGKGDCRASAMSSVLMMQIVVWTDCPSRRLTAYNRILFLTINLVLSAKPRKHTGFLLFGGYLSS